MPSKPESIPDIAGPKRPRRRVLQNTLFSLLIKVQGVLFSYIITRLLLRTMAVQEYGLYSVLFTGILLNLPYLTGLGIPNLLIRFIPELFAESKYRMIGRLFRTANHLQIGTGMLWLLLALLFAPQIAGWLKFPGSEDILRIFAVGALAYLVQENVMLVLSGIFRQRIIFAVIFVYNLVRLSAILYVTQRAYSLLAVTVVEVAALALSLILYFIAYHRTLRPLVLQDQSPSEPNAWRRFLRYTGLSYLNEIGAMLVVQATDLLIVTGILGGIAVGYYGVADKITAMVKNALPNTILKSVIEPLFFSEYSSSQKESVRFGFSLLAKALFFFALPVGVWLALMAEPVIVHLFEPRYAPAAKIITVMAFFIPIMALHMPCNLTLQNAERIDWIIYSKIAGVLKILVSLWLVPQWGVLAMVWISGLGMTLQNFLLYAFIATKLRIHADLLGLLRIVVNGLLAALGFLLIRESFAGLVGLFLSVPFFAILYLVLNILHKPFHPEERTFINSHLPYPLW
ncbi:MAG: oligosaccharide flippase family protein, partial [bacterium]